MRDDVCLDTPAPQMQIMSSLTIDVPAAPTRSAYVFRFHSSLHQLLQPGSGKSCDTPTTHPDNQHTHITPPPSSRFFFFSHTCILLSSPPSFQHLPSLLPCLHLLLSVSFEPRHRVQPPHTHTHQQHHQTLPHYLSRKLHFQHSQGPIMKRERHAVTFLKSH